MHLNPFTAIRIPNFNVISAKKHHFHNYDCVKKKKIAKKKLVKTTKLKKKKKNCSLVIGGGNFSGVKRCNSINLTYSTI